MVGVKGVKGEKIKCPDCGISLPSTHSTIVHRILEHEAEFCLPCSTHFTSTRDRLLHHQLLHTEFRCHLCRNLFDTEKILQLHITKEHELTRCELCDLYLADSESRDHLKNIHHTSQSRIIIVSSSSSSNSGGRNKSSSSSIGNITTTASSCYTCTPCSEGKSSPVTFPSLNGGVDHLLRMHSLTVEAAVEAARLLRRPGGRTKGRCRQTNGVDMAANAVPGAVPQSASGVVKTASQSASSVVKTASQSASSAVKTASQSAVDRVVVQVGPETDYECPMCGTTCRDAGLHLMLQHCLVRCNEEECNTFFPHPGLSSSTPHHSCCKSISQLTVSPVPVSPLPVCGRHLEADDGRVCEERVENPFLRILHLSVVHSVQRCIFCRDEFSQSSLFSSHLQQFHNITNHHILSCQYDRPVISSLLNARIAAANKGLTECRLCVVDDTTTGAGTNLPPTAFTPPLLIDHMAVHHRISAARALLPRIYSGSGGWFSYRQLYSNTAAVDKLDGRGVEAVKEEKDEEEERHAPLVNYNPVTNKRKLKMAAKELQHPCILCNRKFETSDSVQIHLLADHVNMDGNPLTERKRKSLDPSLTGKKRRLSSGGKADERGKRTNRLTDNDRNNEETIDDVEMDNEHFSTVEVQLGKGGEEEEEENDEEEEEEDEEGGEEEEEGEEIVINPDILKEELDGGDRVKQEPLDPQELDLDDTQESVEIVGKIGKSPVFLKCELCAVVLPSILTFTNHMKREHKGSELERNRPFKCELCDHSFYFPSSLNSHKSKAHLETSGEKFTCPLCPSVTNSKNGMRRHLKNSHREEDGLHFLTSSLSFSCNTCGEMFASNAARKEHIAEQHRESSQIEKCFKCSHIAPNRNALRRHCSRMHPGEMLMFERVALPCPSCPLLFQLKCQLSSHIRESHPKVESYKCSHCPAELKNKKSLSVHMRKHTKKQEKPAPPSPPGQLYCESCDRVFDSVKAVKIHFHSAHRDTGKGMRPGPGGRTGRKKCKFCEASFELGAERTLHYKSDHPNQFPYSCTECSAGFTTKSGMYNHRMTHKPANTYVCSHCEKTFTRRDSFKEHILIHMGPRHKCPHCSKEFVQKSNLKRHIRIHLGIKPYKCELCEATFSDKGACNSHKKTHTGEERQSCEICGMTFSKKQKLKYHMRTHTGVGLKSCAICDKKFTHAYALNNHVKIHQKRNSFMCYLCKQTKFKSGQGLYRHLMSHSGLSYTCQFCNRQFHTSKLINRHIQAVHYELQGFVCCSERCSFRSSRVAEMRRHVTDLHSVKTPEYQLHFRDEYNQNISLKENEFVSTEDDLYRIYECLDTIIDSDVLGDVAGTSALGDIKLEPEEEEEEEVINCGDAVEVKLEPVDDQDEEEEGEDDDDDEEEEQEEDEEEEDELEDNEKIDITPMTEGEQATKSN